MVTVLYGDNYMSDRNRQREHDTAQASPRLEPLLYGMRVARAGAEDVQCVMQMMSFLEAVRSGFLPDSLTSQPEAEDLPLEPFDIGDAQACQRVLSKLLEIDERGSFGRIVVGVRALLHPANEVLDTSADTLKLHPRLVQAVRVIAGGWRPLVEQGQIKPGDHLSFTVGGRPLCVEAKQVFFAGTEREEVVYNCRQNHYFITAMALDGTSSHKDVLVRSAAEGGVQ